MSTPIRETPLRRSYFYASFRTVKELCRVELRATEEHAYYDLARHHDQWASDRNRRPS